MKIFSKPIFTGFAPNLTRQDVLEACGFLFLPWRWRKIRIGNCTQKVEDGLKGYYKMKHAFVFDSGRTALYYALKSLDIKKGDEVLTQACTCVVVSNAINWTGAKPVYVDIGNDFNMDNDSLRKKMTPEAKILIIQHTFGRPADLRQLLNIAKERNLKVIEDCAHSLGTVYNEQLTGTFGDIGMLSFGTDKNISCVRGGALITNNDKLAEKITAFRLRLQPMSRIKTIQHLLHYPIFFISKPLYNLGVGKWLLAAAKWLNLINKIIYQPEKCGRQVLFYPSLMPNALAKILLNQILNLPQTTRQRKKTARLYNDGLINNKITKPGWCNESTWLRYTILVQNPQEWRKTAKKHGVMLGDWYNSVIAPADTKISATGYLAGSCPNAERMVKQSVNLPTDPCVTREDAERVIRLVNKLC